MHLDLEGHVILVTGGANGIGAAVARACAREGALPVILDRDQSAAAHLRQELEQQKAACDSLVLDLHDPAACFSAVETVAKRHHRIDGLVNNAGVNDSIGLEHGNPTAFASSFRTNFGHYTYMTQAAQPFLIESRGAIVNIASKVAITGQGGTSGYAAAKGAILGATRDWAAELAPHGIRVNAVVPAEVRTPQYERWLQTFDNPAERLRNIVRNIPLEKRMTEPSEIADLVLFLLSSQSAAINAQQLFVDGGYTHLDRALTAAAPNP